MPFCPKISFSITIIFYYCLSLPAISQNTFQRTYGGSSVDIGNDAIVTNDGGYAFTGYTHNFGPGSDKDIFLIKIDCKGNHQWTRSFGGLEQDQGNSVYQCKDGGYVVTGYTQSYATGSGTGKGDVFLVKLSSAGVFQWFKTYGASTNFENGRCVKQTSDGGFIITAEHRPAAGTSSGLYLIKTDGSGNQVWAKLIGGTGSEGYSVVESKTGGFVAVGRTSNFGAGWSDVYVVKTDTNGNIVWTKTYGSAGNNSETGKAIANTADGGYIIGADMSSSASNTLDVYVIKTDKDGNLQWSKSYITAGKKVQEDCYDIQQTMDMGYIIVGDNASRLIDTTSGGSGSTDAQLIKLDAAGSPQWGRVYGGMNVDHGFSVDQANDGGYVVGGYTLRLGQPPYGAEAYLFKTDPNGVSGCHEVTFTVQDSVIATVVGSGGMAINYGSGLSANPGKGFSPPAIKNLCQNLSVILTPIVITPDTSICEGDSITLIATGGVTYQWSTGASTNSINVSPSVTTTYSVTVNNATCYTPSSASVTVTIIPQPVLTVTNDTNICEGGSATLTANAGTGVMYVWNSGDTTSSITVTPTATSTYYITVSEGACSKTDSVTVTVCIVPAPPVIVLTPSVCRGDTVKITKPIIAGTPCSLGWAESWNPPVSLIPINAFVFWLDPVPTVTTTYTVTNTDSYCIDSASILVTITVNPTPTVTASAANVLCSEVGSGSAEVIAEGGTSPYTYLWLPAGGTTPFASGLSAGAYTVAVTDAGGCRDEQAVTINPGSDLGELYLPNVFSPNADGENDVLQIYYGNKSCINTIQLTIYDRWGEKVFETGDPAFAWNGSYSPGGQAGTSKPLNSSVYVYFLNATLLGGEEISRKGNISLMR